MKIGILPVGEITPDVLVGLQQGLVKTFPDTALHGHQEGLCLFLSCLLIRNVTSTVPA